MSPDLHELKCQLRYLPEGALVWENPPRCHSYLRGREAGWISCEGVRVLRLPGKQTRMVYAHKVVWFLCTGEWLDRPRLRFKDGDKRNIRFENLEKAARKVSKRRACLTK